MKFRRVLHVFLAVVLTSSMLVLPVSAEPSLENQRNQALARREQLVQEIQSTIASIDQIEIDLISKGEEIEATRQELITANENKEQQYQDMTLRIRFMYEGGEINALERILNAGSIAELLQQAEYIQTLHQFDRNMLNEIAATVQQIADLEERQLQEKVF